MLGKKFLWLFDSWRKWMVDLKPRSLFTHNERKKVLFMRKIKKQKNWTLFVKKRLFFRWPDLRKPFITIAQKFSKKSLVSFGWDVENKAYLTNIWKENRYRYLNMFVRSYSIDAVSTYGKYLLFEVINPVIYISM